MSGDSVTGPSAGVLNVRLWVGGSPWRLAAGWTFFAGLILSGSWSWSAANAATVLLALLLVEALWTAIWGQSLALSRFVQPGANTGDTSDMTPPWPYADGAAPLARIWRWMHGSDDGLLSRDVWIALLLAGAVAVTLGREAVVATVGVTLCALAAAAARPAYPRLTRLLYALVAVAWPWWLGLVLWSTDSNGWWPSAAQPAWLLLGAFTLLAFLASEVASGSSWIWLWVAHAAPVAALLAAREVSAAVLTAVVLLAPTLLARRLSPVQLGRWHLAALVTAVAVLWLQV